MQHVFAYYFTTTNAFSLCCMKSALYAFQILSIQILSVSFCLHFPGSPAVICGFQAPLETVYGQLVT